MGGINHQPCGNYLPNSTRLSRAISKAHAHLELANVGLEDVLLGELAGSPVTIDPMLHELNLSWTAVNDARCCVQDLRQQMNAADYVDLPPLHTLDLKAVGAKLVMEGRVSHESWESMLKVMKAGTFYAVLEYFSASLAIIHKRTIDLRNKIVAIPTDASVSTMVEENQTGSFKLEFAALYTAWSRFHADFLASSLISTEVWYAFRGYGSLVPASVAVRAA